MNSMPTKWAQKISGEISPPYRGVITPVTYIFIRSFIGVIDTVTPCITSRDPSCNDVVYVTFHSIVGRG